MTLSIPAAPALFVRESRGRYRSAQEEEVLVSSEAILLARLAGRTISLNDPHAVRSYLCRYFAKFDHEVFVMLALDSQHRLVDVVEVSHGTLDAAAVYPREVLKAALRLNSAAVIFAHQHPSGVPDPSSADRLLTDRLQQALKLVDIRVIDHFVIGGASARSFAECGFL